MGINENQFIEASAPTSDESDKELRDKAFKKFQALRLSIAAGDGKAAATVAESLRAMFADSGALEDLVRTAFTVNYEGTGRALFSIIQDVMFADASIEAARELGLLNHAPASLEMRRAAALESMGTAIQQLGM